MKYPKRKDQMALIGRDCIVCGELYREFYKNGKRAWKSSKQFYTQKVGKIVGFGCTYNGHYTPAFTTFSDYESEPACCVNTKRVPHIKVRFTGEGRAVKVHPSDCIIIKEGKKNDSL